MNSILSKYFSEYLGTLLIVATVVGAGHMTGQLNSDPTVGLVMIALAVGFVLFGAISMLRPISGAHFNPVVTMVFALQKQIDVKTSFVFVIAQFLGAFSGAVIANTMYGFAPVLEGQAERLTAGAFLGEVIATSGLVLIILLLVHFNNGALIAGAVGMWVAAGHFFTSSTSFANPAVTFGRAFTDAVSGIHIGSVPGFMAAQILGALLALSLYFILTRKQVQNV
ncbi:MAG: aquaporin [Aquiluna sp.]|nr:aquaporin [Aquiluna sp.]